MRAGRRLDQQRPNSRYASAADPGKPSCGEQQARQADHQAAMHAGTSKPAIQPVAPGARRAGTGQPGAGACSDNRGRLPGDRHLDHETVRQQRDMRTGEPSDTRCRYSARHSPLTTALLSHPSAAPWATWSTASRRWQRASRQAARRWPFCRRIALPPCPQRHPPAIDAVVKTIAMGRGGVSGSPWGNRRS